MFRICDVGLKLVLYFALGIFGAGLADLVMELHEQTVATYKRGPISAVMFTRMTTGRDLNRRSIYLNEIAPQKGRDLD